MSSASDIAVALDVAASEFYKDGAYQFEGSAKTSAEMADYYAELVAAYPLVSIEDPMNEEDWEGWKAITDKLGDKVQLVGDDLFVTNPERLQRGIDSGTANALLVKVNQIGSLTETLDAVDLAHRRLPLHDEPPLRRDRGHHHRRPRRRDELRPDQDRRPGPVRAGRQVQPAAPHRGGADDAAVYAGAGAFRGSPRGPEADERTLAAHRTGGRPPAGGLRRARPPGGPPGCGLGAPGLAARPVTERNAPSSSAAGPAGRAGLHRRHAPGHPRPDAAFLLGQQAQIAAPGPGGEAQNIAIDAPQGRAGDLGGPGVCRGPGPAAAEVRQGGDRAYTVIDAVPQTATAAGPRSAPVVAATALDSHAPWYGRLWQSVQVADRPTAGCPAPRAAAVTSAADLARVAAQLGRTPRGALGRPPMPVRCPDVVATVPQLPGRHPFPTTFYATCPRLTAAVSTLESAGLHGADDRSAETDPDLAAATGSPTRTTCAAAPPSARSRARWRGSRPVGCRPGSSASTSRGPRPPPAPGSTRSATRHSTHCSRGGPAGPAPTRTPTRRSRHDPSRRRCRLRHQLDPPARRRPPAERPARRYRPPDGHRPARSRGGQDRPDRPAAMERTLTKCREYAGQCTELGAEAVRFRRDLGVP